LYIDSQNVFFFEENRYFYIENVCQEKANARKGKKKIRTSIVEISPRKKKKAREREGGRAEGRENPANREPCNSYFFFFF